MKRLKELLIRWQSSLPVAAASELFIRSLYLILLWSTLKLSSIGNLIWGADYLNALYDPYTNFDRFAMLLNNEALKPFWWVIAVPMIILLLFGLLGWHNALSRLVVAYLFVVLHFGNSEISTGGHHLLQQLLYFHVLLFRVPEAADSQWASAKRFLHHLAFYGIWIQICILYLVAGYWKLKGDLWLPGEALLATLSFKEFGFPWIAENLTQNHWTLVVLNHISLWYQVFFCVLIWIKPIRKWLLSMGLLFHLSIAFLVGITDFGLFMVASYAIFIVPSTAEKWLKRIRVPAISRAYLPS